MSYWVDKIDALIEQQKREETPLTLECIPNITLFEFARRDIAVEIYSEVLNCNIWLCSNEKMVTQIMEDAPGAVCYTANELRHLLSLNPSPESLRRINDAKGTFSGSSIISTKRKNYGPERE
ncbi:MAG: hypothetical protein ACHQ6U_13050 [Thermodesulfobacteriota bacterium]